MSLHCYQIVDAHIENPKIENSKNLAIKIQLLHL